MLFTEKMKQDYLRLCDQTNEDSEPEIKMFGPDGRLTIEYLRSIGRDRDENGKTYTIMPEPKEPIDKSKLTGIAAALDFVYGDKE